MHKKKEIIISYTNNYFYKNKILTLRALYVYFIVRVITFQDSNQTMTLIIF
jgi:hypothetical protein